MKDCLTAKYEIYPQNTPIRLGLLITSVSDPLHFDTAPDPQISFVEKRIRIRSKKIFYKIFFLLITQKNDCYVIL